MTTAAEMLNIYKVRLSMHEAGTISPLEAGRELTKILVDKLFQLDSTEEIENVSTEHLAKPTAFHCECHTK